MNIADLLSQQALHRPDDAAIVTDEAVTSFRDLDAQVRGLAARLADEGVQPGALVGVAVPWVGPFNLTLSLALARMGAVSVPLSSERSAEDRARQSNRFSIKTAVGIDAALALPGQRFIRIEPADALAAPADTAGSFERANWPWRLHVSSGTTARRLKGVLERHDSLVCQVLSCAAAGLTGPGTRFLSALPMTIAAGLRPCLRELLAGATLVFPRSDALEDVATAIDRHAVTHAMLPQPKVMQLLAELPPGALRFPGLRRLIVGGFTPTAELAGRMLERIAADVTVYYGATEIGLITVATLEDLRRAPGSAGRVLPGLKLQIVDGQDRPLAAGDTGVVRVRGIALPVRYVQDPESSQKVFRDGWVYPGDVGRVDADGRLWIESRVDDMVKVGGRIIHLDDIDRALLDHPGIADAAAFTRISADGATRVCAAVVLRGGADIEAVRAYCAGMAPNRRPEALMTVTSLPRNESGKVLRHALARQFLNAGVVQ